MTSSKREKVIAVKNHFSQRPQRRMNLLPNHVRNNFTFAACRDNIHSIVQLFILVGHLPDNLEATSITESILKPQLHCYHKPFESHPDDKSLEGVGI